MAGKKKAAVAAATLSVASLAGALNAQSAAAAPPPGTVRVNVTIGEVRWTTGRLNLDVGDVRWSPPGVVVTLDAGERRFRRPPSATVEIGERRFSTAPAPSEPTLT